MRLICSAFAFGFDVPFMTGPFPEAAVEVALGLQAQFEALAPDGACDTAKCDVYVCPSPLHVALCTGKFTNGAQVAPLSRTPALPPPRMKLHIVCTIR